MHAVTEGSGTDGGDGHTSARRVARSLWKISSLGLLWDSSQKPSTLNPEPKPLSVFLGLNPVLFLCIQSQGGGRVATDVTALNARSFPLPVAVH